MAKRNRYRELESLMTKIIIADAIVFVGFLLFSRNDLVALKVITSIVTLITSLLSLAWLFIVGEFQRRRSLWMVTGFIGITLVVTLSLILGYPCPPVVPLPTMVG